MPRLYVSNNEPCRRVEVSVDKSTRKYENECPHQPRSGTMFGMPMSGIQESSNTARVEIRSRTRYLESFAI